jgi:hypothetical protein
MPIIYFFNNDPGSGYIEMKALPPALVREANCNPDPFRDILTAERAVAVEPRVPFRLTPIEEYTAEAPFEVGFLCKSPGFTPRKSDELIPVIREYIQFDRRKQ